MKPVKTALLSHLACLAILLAQGCQSYTIVQRNVFVDDDGQVVAVDYGRSESDHVNTFVAPATGKELEFRSKLVVQVCFNDAVPDFLEIRNRGAVTNRIELAGESFRAWQCMNFLAKGTMYQTDDGEWKALANGFSLVVYHRTDDVPPRYLEVYRGVVCDTPDRPVRKDDRWRDVTRTSAREYKKGRPPKK